MTEDQKFALAVSQWLGWLTREHPGAAQPVPFVLGDVARRNDKRPAFVKLFLPDSWAANIKGDPKLLDTYVAIRIPGELMAEFKKVSEKAQENQLSLIEDGGLG